MQRVEGLRRLAVFRLEGCRGEGLRGQRLIARRGAQPHFHVVDLRVGLLVVVDVDRHRGVVVIGGVFGLGVELQRTRRRIKASILRAGQLVAFRRGARSQREGRWRSVLIELAHGHFVGEQDRIARAIGDLRHEGRPVHIGFGEVELLAGHDEISGTRIGCLHRVREVHRHPPGGRTRIIDVFHRVENSRFRRFRALLQAWNRLRIEHVTRIVDVGDRPVDGSGRAGSFLIGVGQRACAYRVCRSQVVGDAIGFKTGRRVEGALLAADRAHADQVRGARVAQLGEHAGRGALVKLVGFVVIGKDGDDVGVVGLVIGNLQRHDARKRAVGSRRSGIVRERVEQMARDSIAVMVDIHVDLIAFLALHRKHVDIAGARRRFLRRQVIRARYVGLGLGECRQGAQAPERECHGCRHGRDSLLYSTHLAHLSVTRALRSHAPAIRRPCSLCLCGAR